MESDAAALHSAVRQYCYAQHRHWSSVYASTPKNDSGGSYRYSDRQLDVFPRYNVLNAIRVAVESLDPEALDDFTATQRIIASLGDSADDDFTINPSGDIAQNAQDEEREKFSTFVRQLDRTNVWDFDALPYQRVLGDDETSTVWSNLQRWDVQPNDYWYPLVPTKITGLVAFDSDAFDAAVPSRALSKILASNDIARIWELREHGPSYIQDINCISPIYNGAEGYWTSNDIDWLIYASHEMTITIGGWMLNAVKNIWPKWSHHQLNTLS